MRESDYLGDNSRFLQRLRKLPTLEPFDQKELQGALNLSKIRKYDPGEQIIEEGSYDQWIYFLVSGKVKIVKNDEEVSILEHQGDVFGEMGIIEASTRSASVYALDETVCLALDASYIDRLAGDNKFAFCYILYRLFAECLAQRLRMRTEELLSARETISQFKGMLEDDLNAGINES